VATTPAAATPSARPTGTTNSCSRFAATHTFLHLTAAKENTNGALTVTGNDATMICGGPDDFHYDFASATVTGHLPSGGSLQVLNTSLRLVPITYAKFPSYLATDMNVRVFIFTGPLTAITALSEQFHP
jgi:hypothetical protein